MSKTINIEKEKQKIMKLYVLLGAKNRVISKILEIDELRILHDIEKIIEDEGF